MMLSKVPFVGIVPQFYDPIEHTMIVSLACIPATVVTGATRSTAAPPIFFIPAFSFG